MPEPPATAMSRAPSRSMSARASERVPAWAGVRKTGAVSPPALFWASTITLLSCGLAVNMNSVSATMSARPSPVTSPTATSRIPVSKFRISAVRPGATARRPC